MFNTFHFSTFYNILYNMLYSIYRHKSLLSYIYYHTTFTTFHLISLNLFVFCFYTRPFYTIMLLHIYFIIFSNLLTLVLFLFCINIYTNSNYKDYFKIKIVIDSMQYLILHLLWNIWKEQKYILHIFTPTNPFSMINIYLTCNNWEND